uniref:T-box domain-containing protein n=1 Tax=Naja naja TaxID=35670 RepID=A0A8C6V500_NAJNA
CLTNLGCDPSLGGGMVILGNQNTGTMSGTTPALYVLVKQSTGKPDQGTLLSNQDNSSLLSNAAKPMKSKAKTYLPADCASGNITVMLDNNNMWNEFYHRSTEMILTKQGRRMFPYCRYWISGLESNLKYILVMDISPVDNFRYKWNGHSWEPSGKAEPHVLGRVFIHPESPSTGHYWMHQPVSFYKLKLTNNTLDQEGHIILHSMHRYLPRLHLVPRVMHPAHRPGVDSPDLDLHLEDQSHLDFWTCCNRVGVLGSTQGHFF